MIGAGLFVGSGAVINQTGPAAVLSYLAAGAWLTWLVIVAIVVVIGSMAFVDETRDQLWWSLGSLAAVLGAAWLRTMQPWQRTSSSRTTSTASTS